MLDCGRVRNASLPEPKGWPIQLLGVDDAVNDQNRGYCVLCEAAPSPKRILQLDTASVK